MVKNYLNSDGISYFYGKIKGLIDKKLDISGTAAKATADASGNNIAETYATKAELKVGFAATEDDM